MAKILRITPNKQRVEEGKPAMFTLNLSQPAPNANAWAFALQRRADGVWSNFVGPNLSNTPNDVALTTGNLGRDKAGVYRATVQEKQSNTDIGALIVSKDVQIHVTSQWQAVEHIRFRWSAQKKTGSVCVQLAVGNTGAPGIKSYDFLWRLSADEFQAIVGLWSARPNGRVLYYLPNLRLFGWASNAEGSADWPEPEDLA